MANRSGVAVGEPDSPGLDSNAANFSISVGSTTAIAATFEKALDRFEWIAVSIVWLVSGSSAWLEDEPTPRLGVPSTAVRAAQ